MMFVKPTSTPTTFSARGEMIFCYRVVHKKSLLSGSANAIHCIEIVLPQLKIHKHAFAEVPNHLKSGPSQTQIHPLIYSLTQHLCSRIVLGIPQPRLIQSRKTQRPNKFFFIRRLRQRWNFQTAKMNRRWWNIIATYILVGGSP